MRTRSIVLLAGVTILTYGAEAALSAPLLAFTGSGPSVLRVDELTRDRTTIHGPEFLAGIVVPDTISADYYVYDGLQPSLMRVTAEGRVTTVSDPSLDGPVLSASLPFLAVRPTGRILMIGIATDGSGRCVTEVDPTTGARTIVASLASNAGEDLTGAPTGMCLAPDGYLYLIDGSGESLFKMDLSTGMLSSISIAPIPFIIPGTRRAISVEGPASFLFIQDNRGLVRVASGEGATTEVATTTVGGGPVPSQSAQLIAGPGGDVLIAPAGSNGILRANLITGERTTVSGGGAGVGSGPAFGAGTSAGIAPLDASHVLVGSGSIYTVDLTTGNRSELAGGFRGSGQLDFVVRMTRDSRGNIYACTVTGSAFMGVLRIDGVTGDTSFVSGVRPSTGSGVALVKPGGITLALDDQAVVADEGATALIGVDLRDGTRTVLSKDGQVGGGVFFGGSPTFVQRYGDGTVVVSVAGSSSPIFLVDIQTGDRTLLTSNSTGSGPAMGATADLAVIGDTVYVLDGIADSILSVDPAGNRVLLSSNATTSGEEFRSPQCLVAFDAETLAVADDGRILTIDTTSGTRTFHAGDTLGRGKSLATVKLLAAAPLNLGAEGWLSH